MHSGDPSQADWHPLLTLKKPVMRQSFAHFHDFDVFIVHFPKLAFCQWRGG
jgi:hypothetical protein